MSHSRRSCGDCRHGVGRTRWKCWQCCISELRDFIVEKASDARKTNDSVVCDSGQPSSLWAFGIILK